ncbi:LOW QUALITY PROTEIN: hypothetical protein BC938DRAFT_480375 [Jimgerdemannia flammicorona]|uniref:Uncharacterized protein n=1 Tax=Jimgerdemannia flammicorona TaxID=994334 RepID=A0A433QXA7_9FUNG|nr:LOW QUALITY PROTEIN: hypothetical protein BC938DRAFT_480375 [Jimgerdemannia flammicorona]
MESTHFNVSIDVAAKRSYTIPSRNNSVIQLPRQSSVGLEQDATTWNYEAVTGSLKFGSMLYMHDPSTVDADTTIGFGVTNYKDNEEDYWSVIYIRGDGKGKGRYHTNLPLEDHQLRFLSYDGTDRRRIRSKNFVGRSLNIVGNIYILDDGKTLLIRNASLWWT